MGRQRSVWRLAQTLGAALMLAPLAGPAASAQPGGPALSDHPAGWSSHVHPLNDAFDARPLLKSAIEKSPTIRRLIEALEDSDVTVFLALRDDVPTVSGDLHFMSAAPGIRRLLVRIDARTGIPEQFKWLGHELQHVVEVASAPDVRDPAALARLFARIGSLTASGYETDAAVRVGHQVYREVLARTAKKRRGEDLRRPEG